MVTLLDESVASTLRDTAFSYQEVGATKANLPDGYRHLDTSTALPSQEFDEAAERLMTWRVQEESGLRVYPSDCRVVPGSVVELFLGPRWLNVRAVCRVVYVIDEPDRVGFGYGTLVGHPESGEEAFVLVRGHDTSVFTVRAFSRPATLMARLGGPITHVVQSRITERYLRAIRA